MKMPGGDAAIVDRRKLTGYCLNLEHPRGKHKARVFATLGFTAENADELQAALLRAAANNDAQTLRRISSAIAMCWSLRSRDLKATGSSGALGFCAAASVFPV